MNSQSTGNSRGRKRAEIYDLRDDLDYSQRGDGARTRRPQYRQDEPIRRSRYQDSAPPRRSQQRDSEDLRPRYQHDELARKPHYNSQDLRPRRSQYRQDDQVRRPQHSEYARRSQYSDSRRAQYDDSARRTQYGDADRARYSDPRRRQPARPDGNLRRDVLERKRKEKLQKSIVIMVVYFFLLGLIGITVVKHPPTLFTDPIPKENGKKSAAKQDDNEIQVPSWVQVEYIDTVEEGNPSRSGELLEGVNDIVIHYVANPRTSAEQNRNYFNSPKSDVCSHFLIGLDGEVIQCLPLNEKSAASNDRNRDTISVEVCHPDATGEFTDASYETLVKLTKWLMEQYHLDADHVIRHYDITGKECPLYFVRYPEKWEQFKEDLRK